MGRDEQGVAKSRDRYQAIPRTLCFITHGNELLLLRGGPHKRLWAGLYNGVGGHVEAGEDIYAAAQREISEETGLTVHDLRLRAVIHAAAGDSHTGILIFVFTAVADSRAVTPSSEGTLEWVPKDAVPAEHIMADLPALLARVMPMGPCDPPIFAAYHYDDQDRLVVQFAPPV
jgi:8-oxo-dGTP diphosphatase